MDDDLQTYRFGLKPFISAFIQHFSDIVAVNLLMSLTFLTIVGIPSAFVAGAAVFLRIFRNEPYSLRRDYFTAFKREFRRSLAVGFAVLILGAASIFAASLYYRMSVGNPLLTVAAVLCVALAFVWLATSFYLWPMLAIVDLSPGVIFRNSLQLAFLAAPRNLIVLFSALIVGFIYGWKLPLSLIVIPLFSFGPVLFLSTHVAYDGLRRYVIRDVGNIPRDGTEDESFYLRH